MGTGYQREKNFVPIQIVYRQEKKFWVPMGTGYRPDKEIEYQWVADTGQTKNVWYCSLDWLVKEMKNCWKKFTRTAQSAWDFSKKTWEGISPQGKALVIDLAVFVCPKSNQPFLTPIVQFCKDFNVLKFD